MNIRLLLIIFLIGITSWSHSGHHAEKNSLSRSSADWQIEAYTSAAPEYLGNFATVIGGNGEVLRPGAESALLSTPAVVLSSPTSPCSIHM